MTVHAERNESHPSGPADRVVGTWPWVQITYSLLRSSPDGETIATFHDGYWELESDGSTWSDIIIGN